jgi:hypothetical protein
MVLSYDADANVFPFGANLIAFISSSCITLDVKDSFISIISSGLFILFSLLLKFHNLIEPSLHPDIIKLSLLFFLI